MKREKNLAESKRGSPGRIIYLPSLWINLWLENTETDLSNVVEVRVIDLAPYQTFGNSNWVVLRAEYLYREHSIFEGRTFRPFNRTKEMPVVFRTLPNSDAWDWLTLHKRRLFGGSVLSLNHTCLTKLKKIKDCI